MTSNNEINNDDDEEESLTEWRQQFDTTNEEHKKDNYENCKFQMDCNSEPWSELTLFMQQIQAYEASHLESVCFSSDYEDAVNLWQTRGLTHQQYEAYLVYESANFKLKAYYDRGEDEEEDAEYNLFKGCSK